MTEQEDRTWARPTRRDMRRVLRRAEETAAEEARGDRDLPERWPALVAQVGSLGEPLASAHMRLLEARRARWCKRWCRTWPL